MSQKLGWSYSSLMLVIINYAHIRDSVNLKWRIVILNYAHSTGFWSYYRIPGTLNGGFNSLNHKIAASTFPFIDFSNRMKYYSRNYFVIMPNSTMPSGHSMSISTGISGCINSFSTSHNLEIHPSSLRNKVILIRVLAYVSVATGEN